MEEKHPSRCQTEADCGLPVELSFSKGRPGCVTLELTGAGASPRESSSHQLPLQELQGPRQTVRLRYDNRWKRPLSVVVRGHDHDCSGPVLVTESREVPDLTTDPVEVKLAFEDADGDGVAPTSRGGADCHDADPGVHPWAAERCNQASDDCDADVDEGGACPLSLEWTTALGPQSPPALRVVESYGPGRVWFAGGTRWVGHRASPSEPVVWDVCDGHDGEWLASWVRPTDGRLFLASRAGGLTSVAPPPFASGATCATLNKDVGREAIEGLVGFERDAGSPQEGATRLYGVTDEGLLFTWDGVATVQKWGREPAVLLGIDGADEDSILVVGGRPATAPTGDLITTAPLAYSVVTGDDGGVRLVEEVLDFPASEVGVVLNDVDVVNRDLAYAVGKNGLLLERSQGQWKVLRPANGSGGVPELIDVVAFGPGSVYAVSWSSNNGGSRSIYAYRADAGTWEALSLPGLAADGGTDLLLRGIAGASPDDIWAVGKGGAIYHLRDLQ
ncbi:putative metal-binding motif-containing protein [Cystobacter ferrugineus]|uniref:Uncharacterized protein n=1 Tax=Cystobacter ferrugineus TaxID=83449 RepID=A0A1L9AVW7_9BACT|nr:putative metal-binding motif-containing protein [Cystobacter ferrugineus]OJH34151.1 hypothetical protein BON30_45160 [Cystobacter ferrugineus]